jgi:hypothetical protein
MRTAILCIGLAALFSCSKSSEQQAHEDMAKEAAKHPDPVESAPPPPTKGPPQAAPKVEAPPPPDPTNAADLEKAFKQAMIDQKDKDVLHYCELMKLDDKSSIQSLMGCTLSACRTKNADLASRYAGLLPATKDGKALHDQAKMICGKNSVTVN